MNTKNPETLSPDFLYSILSRFLAEQYPEAIRSAVDGYRRRRLLETDLVEFDELLHLLLYPFKALVREAGIGYEQDASVDVARRMEARRDIFFPGAPLVFM